MSDTCEHGQLRRQCEICEAIARAERAEAERDAHKAEVERLKKALSGLVIAKAEGEWVPACGFLPRDVMEALDDD